MSHTLSEQDIERLERLAREATKGPWCWNPEEPSILESLGEMEHEYGDMGSVLSTYPAPVVMVDWRECRDANRDYIAAAHPDTILALLAERGGYRRTLAVVLSVLRQWLSGGTTPEHIVELERQVNAALEPKEQP